MSSLLFHIDSVPVFFQLDTTVFSEFVSVHGEARLAGNSHSIAKRLNVVHVR
ncbi:hypothetical protein [Nitrosomonas sp. Nm51]|uniref:hypothetical protein n=1 Tax=Nitrosomonas sp. Nm51 TaxID=133720 RepID=UPI0015A5F25F|nr:hypothetical protein [Nitrosomonas sp. Nm51]